MLQRLLTLTPTNEVLTSTIVDVVDSMTIKLNTAMDEEALQKLFMSNKPGTEIPLSKLPYIYTNYLIAISSSGLLSYYPENSILIDYDIKLYDCEAYLATLDENGNVLTHSKYIYNEKGNSGKGMLVLNKLFVEPFIIVPNLGE